MKDHTAAVKAELVAAMSVAMRYMAKAPRDPREPARRRKQETQAQLERVVLAYLRRTARRVRERLEQAVPLHQVKLSYVDATFPDDFWTDDDFMGDLLRILSAAARDGGALFAEMINLTLNTAAVNTRAADWARTYTYKLVKELTDTAREVLRDTISAFVETPGMTVGDVMAALPFDEQRAEVIATTEITRAYAEGQKVAGDEMAKEWPDVAVTKTWFTNNDDLVCPICAPLNGQEVGQDETFAGEFDSPPAHPNCRCWIDYRTRI